MAYQKHADVGYKVLPTIPYAGAEVTVVREFVISAAALNSADVLEITGLPARHKIVDAAVDSEGLTAGTTVTVGLMSGEYASADNARTSGSEIFSAVAPNTAASWDAGRAAGSPAASDADRGIGVKISANESAAGSKKIQLRITYAAVS